MFADPKGTSVEIFSDYAFAKDDGTDAGIMPRKLGHVAFHTPDVAGTVKFYCDVLGFKVSDWRSDFFAFLRCSRDHHTINLLQADNANIHHLAFELRDEAEINRACDFLARKDIKLFWGPIRHLIGHNIAIYHRIPTASRSSSSPISTRCTTRSSAISSRGHGIRTGRSGRRSGATTPPRTIGVRDIRTTCPGRRNRTTNAKPQARRAPCAATPLRTRFRHHKRGAAARSGVNCALSGGQR